MIRIIEDGHPWTLEEHLYMPDVAGNRGIDVLTQAGVEWVPRHPLSPADFGVCKNAAQVHGVSYDRSVLMAWEPPGNIAHLNDPAIRARFMNYLTTCAPIGDPHHFTIPRGFNIIDRHFWQKRDRLVCMISRNRTCLPGCEAQDQYALRRQIVEEYTQAFTPEEFHLYGRWPASPWYKGELYASNDLAGFGFHCPANPGTDLRPDGRYETLPLYHYNICVENSRYPGYVTEKIWHAMAAGCIPVYIGAPDVDVMIPPDLYIDLRRLDLGQARDLMRAQTQDERDALKQRIHTWLTGEGASWFSSVRMAKKVLWAVGKGDPCR